MFHTIDLSQSCAKDNDGREETSIHAVTGAVVISGMARLPLTPPITSEWGLTLDQLPEPETFDGDGDFRTDRGPHDGRDVSHDNTRRAGFALSALNIYADRTGEPAEPAATVITDLLTDLMHLCDALTLDAGALLHTAATHFTGERQHVSP